MDQNKTPKVSVVIPAYKEATYIGRLLSDLAKQDYESFEIIVSDAHSNDGTREILEGYKNTLHPILVESDPKGPSHGRNIGARHARGEWLLFLDADVTIPDLSFIKTLVEKSQEHGWRTSSGYLKVMRGSLLGKIGHSQGYLSLMARTKHPIMQGYCILTRRKEVFEKLRGFNEKIKYGEDNDYATRAAPYGFGFVKEVNYYVDPRRYKQEGLRLLFKNMRHEFYRLTHGFSFENNKAKYEFGKHKKLQ